MLNRKCRRCRVIERYPDIAVLYPRFNFPAAAAAVVVKTRSEVNASNRRILPKLRFPGCVSGIMLHVLPSNESGFRIEIGLNRIVFRAQCQLFIFPAALKTPRMVLSRAKRRVA